MRQDVAIVGDKEGITMDTQLKRHIDITLWIQCQWLSQRRIRHSIYCGWFTLYLGANLISSLKATSVPTTPSRIP